MEAGNEDVFRAYSAMVVAKGGDTHCNRGSYVFKPITIPRGRLPGEATSGSSFQI